MQQFYIIVAIIVFGLGLRSCRTVVLRKSGALVMLLASGMIFYHFTGSLMAGIAAAAAWFFLPWVELLTRIRNMRMPLHNKLSHSLVTNLDVFPNAAKHVDTLEQAGYEHIRNCGWNLGGMEQLYQLFWNAETKSVATLCLCEQSNVTFTYLTISSKDLNNQILRTTNFPFSPTLKPIPKIRWNQVSCSNECTIKLLKDHHLFLHRLGCSDEDLRIPDPDHFEQEIEGELRQQIDYNLDAGIVRLTGDGHFRYTFKGLLFLWRQFVKDMIRLC